MFNLQMTVYLKNLSKNVSKIGSLLLSLDKNNYFQIVQLLKKYGHEKDYSVNKLYLDMAIDDTHFNDDIYIIHIHYTRAYKNIGKINIYI